MARPREPASHMTQPKASAFAALIAKLGRLYAWQPSRHSLTRRLVTAVLITAFAVWLRMAIEPAESSGPFVTATLAVAVSAFYGGPIAALVSTLLGLVLVNYLLIPPAFSFAVDNPVRALWLNFWYLVVQGLVATFIWGMQRQQRQSRESSELIRTNQLHFLATFEHAAAGMCHVSVDGKLLRVNRAFCQLVGHTKEALLGMRLADITVPEDIAPDQRMLAQTLAGQRERYSLEKRYIHKNGQTVWAQLTVALIRQANGLPDYLVLVAQDISASKATEQAIRVQERLMRQAQILAGFASWEWSHDNNEFRALGESHQRLGLPQAVFTGTELHQHIPRSEHARINSEWVAALKGERPYNISYRMRLDGKERWFVARAEFERDDAGRALRAFGVTQEITVRKRAEREIRRLNASLEQRIQERTRELKDAYDELESYSYAVAHDLRSPLRIINGFAQALEEDLTTLEPSSLVHLKRIKGASAKMGELIDGLLKLSQLGRGELQHEEVDLSALSLRLLEEFAAQEPARRVTWEVEPGLYVQADPALMEALMQNLLHNAWKYTGGVSEARIWVYVDLSGAQPRYCVKDNGAGFDMARATKLFQPFQRQHMPHEFVGLGIGLATARRIVLRHGGDLQANSAPGQGATFCFTIPNASETAPSSVPNSGQ
jgi:PAS domain S-box-containing protein